MTGAPWTCPSCGNRASTNFCAQCGERPLTPRDLTLRGLLDQFGTQLTNADGRLLRSFRALLGRPGELTVAYLAGKRKPFMSPVQIFLVSNVLFFAMQSLTGIKVFSTPLESHLHRQNWSALATRMVDRRLETLGTTLDRYAPFFDRAVALHAKSWIVLMVLPLSALSLLLFRRADRPFAAHVAFSLHFYAFFLLAASVATAAPFVGRAFGGDGLDSERFDRVLSVALLAATAAYLYFAVGRAYAAKGWRRPLQAGALAAAVAAIVLGYRFVLFAITLATT